ncbi:hypothetical protein SUGI_0970290 [Cryptomeria japonica]|uniref:lipase-like PAD4 n=1 Tax=Cryptomeria japonica TaxID=3369 RepID=UPI0024149187|nr:lipase-like PAD4 [Cryptomeria japonica]GLJ46057.1 hypothetical protein SUGI_0970290 [Cryptomeria japonica]
MAQGLIFARFGGQENFKASLIEARKASFAANNSVNGYVWRDIGYNTNCLAFSGSLDPRAFHQTDTKFDECKINEGNSYFTSMVDGTTRKDLREPALVYRKALMKFIEIWDANLQQQVADALGTGKNVLFTGHSIGGAIATLATLSILEKRGKEAPVFATTFGFPLIGDEVLARAVRRQGWADRFFNVVSRCDIFARTLLAPCISVSKPLEALLPYWQRSAKQMNDDGTDEIMDKASLVDLDFPMYLRTVLHHGCPVVNFTTVANMEPTNKLIASLKPAVKLSPYRPFGYYLFCSDKGALCVENYEAVLPILFYSLFTAQDQANVSDHTGYGRVFHADTSIVNLEGLSKLPLSQGALSSAMEDQLDALGLGTQARLSLRAAGEVEEKLMENLNKLKAELLKLEKGGHMATLRDYRNRCARMNIGYYDAFKEVAFKEEKEKPDFYANLSRLNLVAFYDRLEEMVETHQVPDDFQFIEELIEMATEYRLLVEPFDIANYYRLGKHEDSGHYMKNARPRRFKAIEKWLADIKPEDKKQALLQNQGQITKDSCFWARVEEISWLMSTPKENPDVNKLQNKENPDVNKLQNKDNPDVNKFQNYVKQLMERNELRVDEVVMGESSFVKWWKKLSPQDQQASPISSIFGGRN